MLNTECKVIEHFTRSPASSSRPRDRLHGRTSGGFQAADPTYSSECVQSSTRIPKANIRHSSQSVFAASTRNGGQWSQCPPKIMQSFLPSALVFGPRTILELRCVGYIEIHTEKYYCSSRVQGKRSLCRLMEWPHVVSFVCQTSGVLLLAQCAG
jgi:hypothetical protein